MNNKQSSYINVWNKYLPVIRILIKKSVAEDQTLGMNRTDFERVGGIRKSGYRFMVNFINDKPDAFYSGNDLVQAFITVLQTDEIIRDLLLKNGYRFIFTTKYQLQIKVNSTNKQTESPLVKEEEMLAS